MLPIALPPSAALTVAELLGPLSALLLLSQLAILGVLVAWLLAEHLAATARRSAAGTRPARPLRSGELDGAAASDA